MKRAIKKVLIANRSEIVQRIQVTCHSRGLETVSIFCHEDRYLPFVYSASQACALSGSGHAAYFACDEIIQIAHKVGADAIHPGYGFLSENADFARRVIDAGLIWVGPAPSCIETMSDKIEARQRMLVHGVPVVPGFLITNFSDGAFYKAKKDAATIGYPLIIKDPKAGGGKAMRKVIAEHEFDGALHAIIAESRRLTGSTVLLVEQYLEASRHIEVQIAGDGNTIIHLFERECSLQRRHQKIIEEAGCNFVPQETLDRMYAVARAAAQAVDYDSIGTVEFMVTPTNKFYFLEMNTRLQVEHAVTEMTTGIDLVGIQLDCAQGKPLAYQQHDIVRKGHAIQCRLYAENPSANFMPATGVISHLSLPHNPFIRVEHGLRDGIDVTPLFDPMIAKFVSFGSTREESRLRLIDFLQNSKIHGIITNQDFLCKLLMSEEFISGAIHTQLISQSAFMERIMKNNKGYTTVDELVIAACVFHIVQQEFLQQPVGLEPTSQRLWREQRWR